MHDVIVIGGEDRRDDERIEAARDAAASLEKQLTPGSTVDITFRKPGRYQMAATLTDELNGWMETAPVHVVVSVAFLGFLPQYNLSAVAKDAFWVVVGKLAARDANGRYIHMQGTGEIAIRQDEVAALCHVSRPTVNAGMQGLMERSFLWKAGRGKYQIHPHLLYFGSAEKQAEAIGYARAHRKDGELPPIPRPGAEVVILTPKGVKLVIA